MRETEGFGRLVMEALVERHGEVSETEAAQLFGVSATWFRHAFKRRMNMSFRDARLRAKIDYGALLLTTTELSISDISGSLGYSNRNKFEKAFKSAYGVTPTVYRRIAADSEKL